MENDFDIKKELHDLLRYYDERLDSCTMREAKSVYRLLVENMEIDGTIDDFAEHYGKSKDAVNGVIKRRMITKPKRNVVLYPFHIFQKLIPEKWRNK